MGTRLRLLSGTPLGQGFGFPAEWEPQEGTWFSWPRPEGISFPARYHEIVPDLARLVREVGLRQRVHINVPNENWERIVREQLVEGGVPRRWLGPLTELEGKPSRRGRIWFHHIRTNESWCRDHGPSFVVRERRGRREVAIVDWGFNAWGGKYPPFGDDDAVPTRAAEELAARGQKGFAGLFLPRVAGRPVVMEGGAVEFNGAGVVMTTEACLLNQNRNPHLSKRQVERALREWYGQSHVLWLGDGIEGDDTDGHIDDLARFVGPRTIVTAVEDDPRDANHKVLRENLRRLELARHPDGGGYEIVTIPMPAAVSHAGQRLPATYLNFLFVNGALLVPTFGDRRTEVLALSTLGEVLRACGQRRRVVGIDCSRVVWGLGTIHCLTQQQPAW